ncbi:MAG TPA: PD-(D/E)XK nuclease family protein [Acidimicrobiia bacterium]|nr:PD-(D/E)XK nuclease family protein [Acidimicrobiia bacterium]
MKKRLLPDIVSITPTNYDDFVQCERRFLNRHLLGIPESDAGAPNETGLLAHDMLRSIHAGGSCRDATYVADVLAGHAADDDHVRQLVERHARRCPSDDATRGAHEQTMARFHRQPQPMFMATARIDAIWIHDGLLDARDYKTGRLWHERVADVPAAKVQAFVLDDAARRRGLQLRLRYEYLSADVTEDPDAWEPDPDDMLAIEEELRSVVERMRSNEWEGVADPALCSHCSYRSICRDSAARGEPTWPVLATETSDPSR